MSYMYMYIPFDGSCIGYLDMSSNNIYGLEVRILPFTTYNLLEMWWMGIIPCAEHVSNIKLTLVMVTLVNKIR